MNTTNSKGLVNWYAVQKDLGCHGCGNADKDSLSVGPCCTLYDGFIAGKDGRCISRKAAEQSTVTENTD